ncbi:hypothetical protein DEU56DRAFT_840705 [Suillus clintonianus]|uniref:uncharacterized protein n=1 Tax=Suillus clintonianus TaxID=1904413 RepID=UPI001B886B07|nr:uncharacterized protein DEU56DRAFT_840705 [Suillus clintonianus]KAG2115505.1 hypothetical protein DEU56DRAFT_840705 [Suillus clintonianus]
MMTATGFLSLPIELICYILILLTPRDVSRCAVTCKFFSGVVRNSVDIQYKLELYAQGFINTEIATMDSFGISSKMHSLKKLASLWRSDFHANTVFETSFAAAEPLFAMPAKCISLKCGLWWGHMRDFLIRDCNTNPKLSRTWSKDDLFPQSVLPGFVTFHALQDLMVVLPWPDSFTVTDAGQDHYVFLVEFRLASSQRPHPHSHPSAGCASFECKQSFDAPGDYCARFEKEPEICGDRVFVFYHIVDTAETPLPGMRGHVSNHIFRQLGTLRFEEVRVRVIDEQKIVVVSSEGFMSLYTLQGLDWSPQCRITYRLPKSNHTSFPLMFVHIPSSFHGTAARPELMPHYVPSLESQIMVIEGFSPAGSVILVIDMVIFSDLALHSESEMPIDIPWSDWGPQYTHIFPHHESHQISLFGSKMAYALPQDCTPEPGLLLRAHHIWDFNKRLRSESFDDPYSLDLRICKPGRVTQSCFVEDTIFSNRAYTAVVCHTPFPKHGFSMLEQDRLTVTWAQNDMVDIQVISPVPTEGGTDPYLSSLPAEELAAVKRRRASKRVQRKKIK